MGNSPSRSELHGEHMSNIVNNSGQETFQSHSYPATKFSANPLPGIHGEVVTASSTMTKHPNPDNMNANGGSSGRQTGGPNTPDPMYSMDSLNVVGTSIASSDLPPSSISPDAQCRNMSRLHKNYHNSDDEGLSSSTFESDSLNPDATLSGMHHHHHHHHHSKTIYATCEKSPKPEVAEEAREELAPISKPAIIDHSTITINGRKVSTCEETPLPLILGSQKESSKVGITTSAELNVVHPIHSSATINGSSTIRRGRLPPPPPPPAVKSSNGNGKIKSDPIDSKKISPPNRETSKDFQNSLNTLLRHNVYSSNRRSNIEISDSKTVCGGEVNVIQTPLLNDELSVSPDHIETEKNACIKQAVALPSSSPLSVLGSELKNRQKDDDDEDVGKTKDILLPTKAIPTLNDASVKIRPIELSKQTQNYTAAASEPVISENENQEKGPHHHHPPIETIGDSQDVAMSCSTKKSAAAVVSTKLQFIDNDNNTTAISATAAAAKDDEKTPFTQNLTSSVNNKTELDCEDRKDDHDHADAETTTASQTKPVSCAANDEKNYEKGECEESNRTEDDKKVKVFDADKSPKPDKELLSHNNAIFTVDNCEGEIATNGAEIEPEAISDFVKVSDVVVLPTEDKVESPVKPLVNHEEKVHQEKVELVQPKTPSESRIPEPVPVTNDKPPETGSPKSNNSRRGSASSSIDLNVQPTTTGLLNCNRLSLCSLPDNNELEFEPFETVEQAMEDVTIQDQPMSNHSSNEFMAACITEEDAHNEKDHITNTQGQLEPSKSEVPSEPKQTTKENDVVKDAKEDDKKILRDGLVNALRNSLEGLIPMMEPTGRNIPPKVNGYGHQRRLSMSRVDFEGIKPRGDFLPSSSVPTSSCTLDKFSATRKGSFPELFIHTESISMTPISVSTGKERNFVNPDAGKNLSNCFPDSLIGPSFDNPNTSSVSFTYNNKYSNDQEFGGDNNTAQNKVKPFAKGEFLQTLGEIYASKSKLLTCKSTGKSPPRSNATSLPPSPNEKDPPSMVLVPTKNKTGESSMDTVVDGLECQDRSISEYNISPRSARELISESLLNSLTSLSQSIGTIHEEVEEKLVAFSAGVEMKNAPQETNNKTSNEAGDAGAMGCPKASVNDNGNDNIAVLHISQPTSFINSGTFKKKPNAPNVYSLPCVDPFEPPPLTATSKNENDLVILEESEKFPPPPPMPPLQYCQTDSSASASSSIGDASEICEKGKVPFNGRVRKQSSDSRHSSEKSWTKSNNGNASSECSLVELSTSNPKSTSDAIIVELKRAQARKLKAMEQKRADPRTTKTEDQCKDVIEDANSKFILPLEIAKPTNGLDKASPALDFCKAPVSLTSSEASSCVAPANKPVVKQPEDPPVKAIVNGKHTNSIIVNSPIVASGKNKNRIGADDTSKILQARSRGNIMSPSLSGNYTEMNGIDSETMGASSIHDDELSGQLQKENHINELHGNVEEVQTSNKLDGASFRRVLNEYEKTLSMFIQQIDQLKQRMEEAETEKQTLIRERDQALEDLRNVESAFSDVHRKYERAKALLENMKTNEDTLIRRDQEMMQRIQNRDKKIEMIKDKAQESIEKMHLDYETRIKEMEFENAKLRALNRKNEMKLSTLENDVEQKAKENAQLSALCDELINGQVGQV